MVDVTGHSAAQKHRSRGLKFFSVKVIAVTVWLAFSVSLTIWLLIFGLRLIDQLARLGAESPSDIAQDLAGKYRMFFSEGLTLIILLIGGGVALLYYINTEIRRAQRIQGFFASFSHDLKTSLASVRLQAESLEEDLKESEHARIAKRLVKDTVRLELQLENSLLLASPEGEERLLTEPVHLTGVLHSMRHQWPDLELEIEGRGWVQADQRAVESIIKNLMQNAVVHGRATRMKAEITPQIQGLAESEAPAASGDVVRLRLQDNGRGFAGDVKKLGEMFLRHGSTSGSGLGIYLAMSLARRMHGKVRICESQIGFCVEIELPAANGPKERK